MSEQFALGRQSGRPVAPLDDVDRSIITCLLKDGHMSSAAVARVVGASSRTVGYRIARLTRMGVIKVGAVVDPRSLGLEVIADVFMEVVPGRVREVAERFARLEEVSYVAGSIGNGDLSIQVYLRNGAALTRFIDEVVGQTPGVTRARTVLVPWKLKDVYQWNVPAIADPGDG